MTIIDLDTVKTNLGISDAAYDAQIAAQIPIIDAKVKQICNNNFNTQVTLSTTTGVPYVELWGVFYYWGGVRYERGRGDAGIKELIRDIPVGTYIEGEGLARTHITEVYYDGGVEFSGVSYGAPCIKVATNPSATANDAQAFVGWNKAYDSVVSKGIWWLINQASTAIEDGAWTSKRYGPVSVTKGGGADIKMDLKSGMPLWFVKALPRYMR